MKTDIFQSCGHCWVFQVCWHVECSTFTASSFSIWNSLTGIPSPPLALFVVMLPKAYLTSHSRMSDSRWVITPSWLSGLWRSFLYSSSGTPHSKMSACLCNTFKNMCQRKGPVMTHTHWLKIKNLTAIWASVPNIGLPLPVSGFPGGPSGKEASCQCKRHKRHGFDSWDGKIPWRKAWWPTCILVCKISGSERGACLAIVQRVAKLDTTEAI